MNAEMQSLIPYRSNLKHLDWFEDESQIIYLFGRQFAPALRALVSEIEQLAATTGDGSCLQEARAELESRRWELFRAVRNYLNSHSVGRAQIVTSDGGKKPGYEAIGDWLAGLPPAVFPPISDALFAKLGLAPGVKTAARSAYESLMGISA